MSCAAVTRNESVLPPLVRVTFHVIRSQAPSHVALFDVTTPENANTAVFVAVVVVMLDASVRVAVSAVVPPSAVKIVAVSESHDFKASFAERR